MTVSMTIFACFLALLFASSAVSSKSVLLEDHEHDQDFRPAHTVVDSLTYHVEDSNGLSFTHSIVTPKRLKGTTRKLAVISETRNEEKQMTEKKRNSVDNAVQNGGLPVKDKAYKQKDSKKIKHPRPSSSGVQTSLSLHQENKIISRDQMATSFTFQKKTTRTLLRSSASSLGDNSKQDEASKRDEASFQGAKTPSTPHESHNFSTSRSSTYQSNETDLSDLVDMDYGKVHRKPPIHNSSSP